jgi:predicted DNA-binding protein (MmcQ/YjbR family)
MNKENRILPRVRQLCLSLPETSEVGSWGHPNFRAGKRTFVAFEWIKERPSIAFRLNPTDIDLLLRRNEFFVTPYGRGQWVSVWADSPLDWGLVEQLLERSYRMVALKRMIVALDASRRGPNLQHPSPGEDRSGR